MGSPIAQVQAERTAELENNLGKVNPMWKACMATHLTPWEAALAKVLGTDLPKLNQEALVPALAAVRANDIKESLSKVVNDVRQNADSVAAASARGNRDLSGRTGGGPARWRKALRPPRACPGDRHRRLDPFLRADRHYTRPRSREPRTQTSP